MKHVHAPGKCNKGMMGALNKHLRIVTAAGSALLLRWVKKQGARIFAAL